MKKLVFGLIMVVVLIVSGCFSPAVKVGSMRIKLDFPGDFQAQFADDITLSTVMINLTQSGKTVSQTISASESVAVFNSLGAGNWTVEVLVKDSANYTVFTGSNTASVSAGQTAQLTVPVTYVPGDLNATVTFGWDVEVVSGTFTLVDPRNAANNIAQSLAITSTTNGSATFIGVKSTTWPVEVKLYNGSNAVVAQGTGYVDILPGRINTINVTCDAPTGSLNINVVTDVPAQPTGLTGAVQNSAVVLNWNASTDSTVGYMVFRSTGETNPKVLLNQSLIFTNTYTDNTIDEGVNYYYWVQAVNTNNYASKLSEPSVVSQYTPQVIAKLGFISHRNGNNDICVVNADGTGETNLTNTARGETSPAWSPDGTKIIYVDSAPGESSELYLMNLDGTNKLQITNNSMNEDFAEWSPDGTKIAFWGHSQIDYLEQIYVMNVDGSNLIKVSIDNYNTKFDQCWSPDSTKLAYVSYGATMEVYVVNADGTNPVNITNGNGGTQPRWSPDGTKIAFISSRDGDNDIYLMNPDGTNVVNITNDSANVIYFTWSPDGSQIAFTSDDTNTLEIYSINVDGSNRVRLTNNAFDEHYLKWSFDGAKIAYAGNGDIYVINADGTNEQNVTNSEYSDNNPVWFRSY